MPRLRFCTDEHAPEAYVSALESNGYDAVAAADERGERTVDPDLLAWCSSEGRVLVTNDRDFTRHGEEMDHEGVIIYTSQGHSAGEFMRAIRRIDRQFSPDAMRNTVVWLEDWL